MDGDMKEAVELLVMQALKEIRNRAPHVPGYFENILYICTLQHFPEACKWFREEIDVIIDAGEEAKRWSELLQLGIVQASRRQIPPLTIEDKNRWQKLMQMPRYANTAFFTLAPTPLEQLVILEEWWSVKPEHPNKTLQRVVRNGNRIDSERFNHRLRRLGATWSMELRMKFNAALEQEGLPIVFPRVSETAEV